MSQLSLKKQSPSATAPLAVLLCLALFACGPLGRIPASNAPSRLHSKSLIVRLIQDDRPTRRNSLSASILRPAPFQPSTSDAALAPASQVSARRVPHPLSSHTLESSFRFTQPLAFALRFRPPPSAI
jgi:hypothetical protein